MALTKKRRRFTYGDPFDEDLLEEEELETVEELERAIQEAATQMPLDL
jgi:hypothetical protein